MNQTTVITIVFAGVICLGIVLFNMKRKRPIGFKDFIKNTKPWEKAFQKFKADTEDEVLNSKKWSDTEISSQVKIFLFDIKTSEDARPTKSALEQLGDKIHPHVLRYLKDPSFQKKLTQPTGERFVPEAPFNRACDLLGDKPPLEATAIIEPFLNDPSAEIRKDAASVLGKIGSSEAILPLKKALNDSDEYVQCYAVSGLQQAFENSRLNESCRKELFQDLQLLLINDANSDASNIAARLLLDFDVARAKDFFLSESFFRSDSRSLDNALRAMSARKIPVPRDRLLNLIQDLQITKFNSRTLAAALKLLGQLHQQEDVAFLDGHLSNNDEHVAEGAANGLLANKGLEDFAEQIFEKAKKSGYSSLTQNQRNWLAVEEMDSEISNGGLSQYFVNSSGNHWEDALSGLNEIGAKETASILLEAVGKFQNEKPSTDLSKRREQLSKLMQENDEAFEQLDKRYYKSKSIIKRKQTQFIISHAEDFR